MHLNRDFPRDVARGSGVTIEHRSEVVALASGFEERNRRWSGARRSWSAGLGIRSADDLADVVDLFEEAGGRAASFRFQDWGDWKSCAPSAAIAATDQALGTGDGSTASFQVRKRYGAGPGGRWRDILLPRQAGFRVALGGVEVLTGWSLSATGGVLTFDDPPGSGVEVSAGFAFDCVARFDTDELPVDYQFFDMGGRGLAIAPDIPLREVLRLTA